MLAEVLDISRQLLARQDESRTWPVRATLTASDGTRLAGDLQKLSRSDVFRKFVEADAQKDSALARLLGLFPEKKSDGAPQDDQA